jgi:hypothetical protein
MKKIKNIRARRKQIINKIEKNLDNLNKKSENYIKDAIKLLDIKCGMEEIISIILFGSQSSGIPSNISDCDLLIILNNSLSEDEINQLNKYFLALELKHGFLNQPTGLIDRLFIAFQKATGMFVSHFIVNFKSWKKKKFYKIFNINKIFSYLLAPRDIVFHNVINTSKVLYKANNIESLTRYFYFSPKAIEMIKSIIMNYFLTVGAILFMPFNPKSIRYLLESVKWSLRTSNYYIFEDSKPLKKITSRFLSFENNIEKKGKISQYFKTFIKLRNDPKYDFGFFFKSLYRILKIHIQGIIFRKMLNA